MANMRCPGKARGLLLPRPHRAVRAPLTHTVPRITDSLCI